MAVVRYVVATGLVVSLAACGSQPATHNETVIEQLDIINRTTPEGAGSANDDASLIVPSAEQIGQDRRAAAAQPPPPKP